MYSGAVHSAQSTVQTAILCTTDRVRSTPQEKRGRDAVYSRKIKGWGHYFHTEKNVGGFSCPQQGEEIASIAMASKSISD